MTLAATIPTSMLDEEDIFQHAFDEFQSTLLDAEEHHRENHELREELDRYLAESQTKRGSDGKMLLSIPDNFDVIANAMSRQDLLSEEPAPWSKVNYLSITPA